MTERACSASDRQGSNFESCVWRKVSSHSSHHPQEVLLAQFSLYVHKCGLKPDLFHFSSDSQTQSFLRIPNCSSGFIQDFLNHYVDQCQILMDFISNSCSSGFIQDFLDHYVDRCRFNVGCSHIRGMNRLRLKCGQSVQAESPY